MKKMLIALLSAALLLSLCACDKLEAIRQVDLPPLPEVSIAPEKTPAPETPVPEPEESDIPEEIPPEEEALAEESKVSELSELSEQVIIHIASTVLEAFDPAEGAEKILQFSYETPYVDIVGRSQASEAINGYLALLEETYYTGNDYGVGEAMGYQLMLELAEDNYGYVVGTGAEDLPLLFAAVSNVAVQRGDGQVLSLVYGDYSFTGGVHGSYGYRGYVFDTDTGERLHLETLTEDYSALSSFLVEYMVGLTERDPEAYAGIDPVLAEDYAAAFEVLLRDGSWYLDGEGLVIFSDLYEISSYAAGIIEFHIPYAELQGKVYDKYLPEARQGSGDFSVLPMTRMEDGTLEILDRVSTGAEGEEELCLIVNGTVYDVKVSTERSDESFFETRELWYVSCMNNCALQVSAAFGDGAPELTVSYRTADGESHTLVLVRGENGDPTLAER